MNKRDLQDYLIHTLLRNIELDNVGNVRENLDFDKFEIEVYNDRGFITTHEVRLIITQYETFEDDKGEM